ncbi:MAG: thioesterase family protein [Comamonadaceae bacterium]|nr:MAG: thioesterase family protein [Comamonadaceae bacterium]
MERAGAVHALDAAIALEPVGRGAFTGRTHPAWANMIGPYGGATAAQVLNAVLQHPDRLGEPVALTVNYAAAVADGPFALRATPARTNRSTQHWTIELVQQDAVAVTATAVTAVRRETWSGHEAPMPEVPRPDTLPRATGRGVEWINRYDMRFVQGNMPVAWDGHIDGESISRLWVRDDPPRPVDAASLTAIADVFFPRIWLRRATFVPVGTVSMTVYFHADAAQLAATGTGFLLAQARGQAFGRGFFDQAGLLWNEAGTLLATTHQVVYYKE